MPLQYVSFREAARGRFGLQPISPEPWLPVLFRIRYRNRLAEALLGIGVPIAAIEFEEDRGVRDGHFRFDDENAEDLGGLIEFGNDLLVRDVRNPGTLEQDAEISTVVRDARRVYLGNKSKLLVRIDLGADVGGGGDC
jgi:hypothetical protein